MTHNQQHLIKIRDWILAHWDDWYFVRPGNGEATFELIKALKNEGVIRSASTSHALVLQALKSARAQRQNELVPVASPQA